MKDRRGLHFQRRDWLRLVIGYRRKYLESLARHDVEDARHLGQQLRHTAEPSVSLN